VLASLPLIVSSILGSASPSVGYSFISFDWSILGSASPSVGYSFISSARYRSTALTRRWTSTSSDRPSFEKSELMCFSTAR
jgi:hypothetical protein